MGNQKDNTDPITKKQLFQDVKEQVVGPLPRNGDSERIVSYDVWIVFS